MKKAIVTILKGIAYFIGWAVLAGLLLLPIPDSDNPAIWRFWAEFIPFLCIIGISFFFWLIEKRTVPIFPIGNITRSCLTGLIFGALWLAVPVVTLFGIGLLDMEKWNRVSMLGLWFVSVLINTIMQELLVRGYLYQLIKKNYNGIIAAFATTALFTFLHGGALEAGLVPVLNVLTMSLLMTIALEYTGSLLTPIVMHFLWNGIGAILLGGVSLAEDYPHVLTTVFKGNPILSGGAYKLEGSIIVLFMNSLLIAVFLVLQRKK